MSFATRLTRMPRAFDPDQGRDAARTAPWAQGAERALIEGAAGSSPYLKGLLTREGAWLEEAMQAPEQAFDALLAGLAGPGAEGDLAKALRQVKRRAALLIALADLGGVWPLAEVTGRLTDLADACVDTALRAAMGREIKRGKLPGAHPDGTGGIAALAMGKMGAHELNYSSDIDLICLFDETRYAQGDAPEARAALVRATRQMVRTLSDVTAEGYVFRTDLRLRPDASVTPVVLSMEAAERYYESLGRTWERAAYIKARVAAGDRAAGARFLQALRPFVWRKHLDFAAIEDAHAMRLAIRAHKGRPGPIRLEGHNMKLGRGGIREIEFFTQTRQLIAGGRDANLRCRGTVEGLARLAQAGWVPEDVARTLSAHYTAHREVEHRLQMVQDAQTHDLPATPEGFDRLACLMGEDSAALRQTLSDRLAEVDALAEGFFARDAGPARPLSGVLQDSALPARWPSYPALRSERALAIFERLKPDILARLETAPRPAEALAAFDGFLAGLPAGVQLFSLFEANPQILDLLADIVSVSPDLARHLARNAGVFDAVIAGDFFAPWPGAAALTQALEIQAQAAPDYESALDGARRWAKEWHFRIGVHLLRGLTSSAEAGAAYADLAQACLAALWPVVQAEFARKHGPPPGRGAVVLGMGSLGEGWQHARSDLDVIVIYDAAGVETSTGRRPLPARSYYARLTQALVTALSAPMAQGRLYEIDMRLRPSGNQGPVATSWPAFQAYQQTEAWVWEHLALTRARVVAGPQDLAADVHGFRAALLGAPRDRAKVLAEVAAMRARITAAKGEGGPLEAKLGRGRMQDIALYAQAESLLSPETPRGVLAALDAAPGDTGALSRAYALFSDLQMALRLVGADTPDTDQLAAGCAAFLLRHMEAGDMSELISRLDAAAQSAGARLDQILQGGTP